MTRHAEGDGAAIDHAADVELSEEQLDQVVGGLEHGWWPPPPDPNESVTLI